MDLGLLILRLVVGGLLLGHGAQKLFGWFGGDGLRGTGAYVAGLGYRPGLVFALLAGLAEAGSGALIALGLGMPFASALLITQMVNAYSEHAGKGIWNDQGGWELPLLFGATGALLAFSGAGAVALDAVLGWDIAGYGWGVAAIAAGLGGGILGQISRRLSATETVASAHQELAS